MGGLAIRYTPVSYWVGVSFALGVTEPSADRLDRERFKSPKLLALGGSLTVLGNLLSVGIFRAWLYTEGYMSTLGSSTTYLNIQFDLSALGFARLGQRSRPMLSVRAGRRWPCAPRGLHAMCLALRAPGTAFGLNGARGEPNATVVIAHAVRRTRSPGAVMRDLVQTMMMAGVLTGDPCGWIWDPVVRVTVALSELTTCRSLFFLHLPLFGERNLGGNDGMVSFSRMRRRTPSNATLTVEPPPAPNGVDERAVLGIGTHPRWSPHRVNER